jgi:hypothetical protein
MATDLGMGAQVQGEYIFAAAAHIIVCQERACGHQVLP